jgi:ATP-binding cassette subfamily B protein
MHSGGWWRYIEYDEKDKPTISTGLLKRVAQYARPYTLMLGLLLAAIFASSLIGLVPPLLYRAIVDDALGKNNLQLLILLSLGLIAVPLLDGLIGMGNRYLSSRVGESLIADLRKALYQHMQKMSLRFFTNVKTGELISRLDNDVIGAQRAVTGTFISIITNAVNVVLILGVMIALDWRLTLFSLLVVPLFVLPARRVGLILRRLVKEQYKLNAELDAQLSETLNVSGALLTKLFARQKYEVSRLAENSEKLAKIGVEQAIVGRGLFLMLGLVAAVGTAVVYLGGGILVIQGTFTVGTIIAFGAYLSQLYGPVSSLINSRVDLATSLVSFERVFETLNIPIEIQDRPDAVELKNIRGDIRFENVSFSYLTEDETDSQNPYVKELMSAPPKRALGGNGTNGHAPDDADENEAEYSARITPTRRLALHDVSFEIKAGQLVALVGPSGAGKTTITYLIPRLYDPTAGRILIDGHDLRAVTQESLAQQIGMVTQETYLFHDTVRANLLYGKPDATPEEMEAAARAANIHDFIAKLPKGYDTIVGERGYRLSGGEKQRVAIARVILKNPRILVLDEATSSLDSESEALIQDALKPLMRHRTSVVIAHRLSTILAADVILVVDDGQIVERGTHAELLAQDGLYARLYRTQFREQILMEG